MQLEMSWKAQVHFQAVRAYLKHVANWCNTPVSTWRVSVHLNMQIEVSRHAQKPFLGDKADKYVVTHHMAILEGQHTWRCKYSLEIPAW